MAARRARPPFGFRKVQVFLALPPFRAPEKPPGRRFEFKTQIMLLNPAKLLTISNKTCCFYWRSRRREITLPAFERSLDAAASQVSRGNGRSVRLRGERPSAGGGAAQILFRKLWMVFKERVVWALAKIFTSIQLQFNPILKCPEDSKSYIL